MGGIDTDDFDHPTLTPDCALVHWDVWQNASKYWHSLNRKTASIWMDIEAVKTEALKEKGWRGELKIMEEANWSDKDYFYNQFREHLNKTDYGLTFRNMIEGKDITGHPDKYCFLERNKFMDEICERVMSGQWRNKDILVLNKLICLYSGEMVTGRAIRPSRDVCPEQYPNYKQRIRLLEFTTGLAKKMNMKYK